MRRTLHSIAALPMPRQRYADGGFVQRLKQIAGLDPERNARIAEYRAQVEREKQAATQPPAPPTPQPQSATSGYNGMSAAERRMKEQGLKDGGHVRGPGTGTSDSIPAMLSDGEFVMPADTVRKVGVRRLQDLVDTTHKPVREKGPNHYANGDLVEDPTKRPNSFGDAAAATKDSLVNQIPTGGLKAPAADGSQDRWSNTETGRNLTNIASALPGSVGNAIPAVLNTGGAISSGLNAATRLLGGTSAGAALGAVATAPATAQTSAADRLLNAGRGAVNPPSVDPTAPPPSSPPRTLASIAGITAPGSDVTRQGNSYSGTNVSGDITINGQAPRAGGQISPQNLAAADNLAAGQAQGARARLMAAGAPPAPSVQSPTVRNSTNDWAARKQLENLATGASSITNTPEWSRGATTNWRGQQVRGQADQDGKVAAYQAALKSDLALQQAQPVMDQAAMRENGNLQREGMQQSGETQRTNIRAQRDDAANQIARGRLTLEQIAAGYQNRASDRMDRAQSDLEKAKTPEAQRSARDRLLALAGKAPQSEWGLSVTPTTKNADGSTTQGSIYRYNKTTGETARVDAGQSQTQTQFEIGKTYVDGQGRRATFTAQGWKPA